MLQSFLTIRSYHCLKSLLRRRSLAVIGNWLKCGIQTTTPRDKQKHNRCSFRSRRHMSYCFTDISHNEEDDYLMKRIPFQGPRFTFYTKYVVIYKTWSNEINYIFSHYGSSYLLTSSTVFAALLWL